MELRHYLNIIWRRSWIIILSILATLLVVIVGTKLQTPMYTASTTLRIATSSISQTYSDYTWADRLMNTYVEISTSGPVMAEVMKKLNLTRPVNVIAAIVPNTELIKITVQDPNPKTAAAVANTLANVLLTQSSQLYAGGGVSSQDVLSGKLGQAKTELNLAQQEYQALLIETPPAPGKIEVAQQALNLQQNTYGTLLAQYQDASIREALRENLVTIIEPATIPQSSSSPNSLLSYVLALVIGLVGGIGLLFLFENLDTNLHTLDDIESVTKMDTLAKIPRVNKNDGDISKNAQTQYAETLRNLSTRIQMIDHQQGAKVLLLMSAEPRQGKSLIVSNLAYALAETGKKVVAVDCDLRRPTLHTFFHVANEFGLTDILEGKKDIQESLQASEFKGVSVLTTGSEIDHPSKLLSSPQMSDLIDKLSKSFDYVLLDTPALLPFPDTEILAHYANGILLVVRQARARRENVQAATKFMASFPRTVLGTIVNQVKDHNGNYGYYRR